MADLTTTPVTLPRQTCSGRLVPAGSIAGLCIAAIFAGPYFLDAYTVNILVRSFLYAATALTVDILWGHAGILTFGQAAFFGIGAYAAGITFTYMDFSPQTAGRLSETLTVTDNSRNPGGVTQSIALMGTGQLLQTMVFLPPASVPFGSAPVNLARYASASSGLMPTFQVISGPGVMAGSTLILTGSDFTL